MAESRTPLDPDRKRLHYQFLGFAIVAAVIVILLVWMQYQHGTVRNVAIALGLPILAVLWLIAYRFKQKVKRT
jgi:phosphatidylserine synthase